MILRNDGLLTVGESPAQAFLRMYYLERGCQIQLAAQAGGAELIFPSPDVCALTWRQFNEPAQATSDAALTDTDAVDLAWAALLRMLDRIDPSYKG